ncbi:hypothetical protein B0H10DRAFT_2229048 [Mycena sp. CBHHK59/15]|nr:hypothetical protein B0H10DRAFT_2229048 [Mycena sp. CBHHK59/15]
MRGLTRVFARILRALWKTFTQASRRRVVGSRFEKQLLLDCEKSPQDCLDLFETHAYSEAKTGMKLRDITDEAFEEQAMAMLASVKKLLAEVVFHRELIEAAYTLNLPPDLPPAPRIFYGRDRELSELTHMFSQDGQAHAVLLGQGGSGKSSLALALMHRAEILHKFRHRRFLVNCDSSAGLLLCLASALGLSDICKRKDASEYRNTVLASLTHCTGCLLVFDDLDDAWDPPETRLDVEDLLTELSLIPSVSLLLTLRGTQRPLGPAYTRPYPGPLGPLPAPAARQLFLAISGLDLALGTHDAVIGTVLRRVGCLPRPVVHLAQRAQYEPLSFLVARCAEEGVDVAEGVAAALHGARVVAEGPAALEVLRVLVLFPGGVARADAAVLVGARGGLAVAQVRRGLSVLCRTSLVVVVANDEGREERLEIPEVVRDYLARHTWDGARFIGSGS